MKLNITVDVKQFASLVSKVFSFKSWSKMLKTFLDNLRIFHAIEKRNYHCVLLLKNAPIQSSWWFDVENQGNMCCKLIDSYCTYLEQLTMFVGLLSGNLGWNIEISGYKSWHNLLPVERKGWGRQHRVSDLIHGCWAGNRAGGWGHRSCHCSPRFWCWEIFSIITKIFSIAHRSDAESRSSLKLMVNNPLVKV